MSPRRRRVTVSEMLVRGGYRHFRAALRYAARVGQYVEVHRSAPDIKQYQAFHGLSQAQAYRDWRGWKRCVPDYSVLEVVSDAALRNRGLTDEDREDIIARDIAGGGENAAS